MMSLVAAVLCAACVCAVASPAFAVDWIVGPAAAWEGDATVNVVHWFTDGAVARAAFVALLSIAGVYFAQPTGRTIEERLLTAVLVGGVSVPRLRDRRGRKTRQRT